MSLLSFMFLPGILSDRPTPARYRDDALKMPNVLDEMGETETRRRSWQGRAREEDARQGAAARSRGCWTFVFEQQPRKGMSRDGGRVEEEGGRGEREGRGGARSLAWAVQGASPASKRWAPNQAVDTAEGVVQDAPANGCGAVGASDEDGTLATGVSWGTAFQAAVKRRGREGRRRAS